MGTGMLESTWVWKWEIRDASWAGGRDGVMRSWVGGRDVMVTRAEEVWLLHGVFSGRGWDCGVSMSKESGVSKSGDVEL
jgi:hypothetical protein